MRLAEEKQVGISGIVEENVCMGRWIAILLCAAVAEASVDVERVLDIRRWIVAQEGGESILAPAPEQVGKVISCIGDCRVYRGAIAHGVRWLSRLVEGDEIHTGPRSYLWLMLIDGTLVRVSPETHVAILEVALTPTKAFFQARVAQGQVYWLPRDAQEVAPQLSRETDQLFLPLMDAGANLETFAREDYRKRDEFGRVTFWEAKEVPGLSAQYHELNRLLKENNDHFTRAHEAMVIFPNGTVHTFGQPVHLFHMIAGPSWFKLGVAAGTAARFYFRGYAVTKEDEPVADQWWEVHREGRQLGPPAEAPALLAASELVVRRIPTFLLLRERWLREARAFWVQVRVASAWVATKGQSLRVPSGHLVVADGPKRIAFLKEHTRRLETTNLRSLHRLYESQGQLGFDGRFFGDALDAYFHHLKTAQGHAPTSVIDMSPLHYYGWMLINARQNR
jgi:hypothetical protein